MKDWVSIILYLTQSHLNVLGALNPPGWWASWGERWAP